MNIIDVIGILGVAQILFAYFLIQSKIMKADNLVFSLLNFFGAILILYSLYYNWNLASVIIEIAWIIISILGIYKSLRKQLQIEIS